MTIEKRSREAGLLYALALACGVKDGYVLEL